MFLDRPSPAAFGEARGVVSVVVPKNALCMMHGAVCAMHDAGRTITVVTYTEAGAYYQVVTYTEVSGHCEVGGHYEVSANL